MKRLDKYQQTISNLHEVPPHFFGQSQGLESSFPVIDNRTPDLKFWAEWSEFFVNCEEVKHFEQFVCEPWVVLFIK